MPHVRRLRMSNPRKRRKSNSRRKTRRNPVGEVLIVANPRRRRSKKSYRRRSKASRRSNPFLRRHHIRRRGHRRSNPGIAGFNSKELLELSLGAGAGVLGSKYAAQLLLGDSNSGWTGYLGTGAIILAMGWLANKFVGKNGAVGVVAGGGGALLLRIFQEQVSGTSAAASMSGLGDPDMRALGVRGMGDYVPGTMPMPAMFSTPVPVVTNAAPTRRRG